MVAAEITTKVGAKSTGAVEEMTKETIVAKGMIGATIDTETLTGETQVGKGGTSVIDGAPLVGKK